MVLERSNGRGGRRRSVEFAAGFHGLNDAGRLDECLSVMMEMMVVVVMMRTTEWMLLMMSHVSVGRLLRLRERVTGNVIVDVESRC